MQLRFWMSQSWTLTCPLTAMTCYHSGLRVSSELRHNIHPSIAWKQSFFALWCQLPRKFLSGQDRGRRYRSVPSCGGTWPCLLTIWPYELDPSLAAVPSSIFYRRIFRPQTCLLAQDPHYHYWVEFVCLQLFILQWQYHRRSCHHH